ncbi:tRNA uracil 4-sulfurtransferase ThiI [Vulcanisaeta sp. JCM 14467]|uniref:tRNA uracil 4-sulfurtransferase ThiI n=1 Tax=Vulcanisaeta sp. JCM 14467 TaxID=1295370 RepID=UPI0006D16ED5|nr:tRNA uracil 4-sulfurtransferase ThiI [Vulcanisaeta sp. JCM 14467]
MALILVRYGEVAIKGAVTRSRMEGLLVHNILSGLRGVGVEGRVVRSQGRLFVEVPDDRVRDAVDVVSRVFGVKSLSPVREYQFRELGDIVNAAVKEWGDVIRGRRFAVRVHRVGSHGFTSMDVAKAVGAALKPFSAGVDLERPDVELFIEVRGDRAYLFTEVVKGPGGLPLGSEGRLLALISGGFDSPVAAWFMMRRGSYIDALFCSLAYPIDVINFLRVSRALFTRWSIGYDPRLFVIDCSPLISEFRARANPHMWSVLFKRVLYVVASRVASSIGALGIVTGESLGQVSSQTLHNLAAIEHGIDIPIYRPLIGLDKDEIVDYARRIGTYEESMRTEEFCAIFSEKPRTRVTADELNREFGKLSGDLIDKLLGSMVVLRVSSVDKVIDELMLGTGDVSIDHVPKDAVVIDLRSRGEYEAWHYPGAINVDADKLISTVESMGRDKVYVLYCSKGLSSRWGALELRRLGFKAFSIDIDKLRRSL